MSNVLEDLMYESGLTAQGCWDTLDEYDKRAIQTFAKLIVLECAHIGAWEQGRQRDVGRAITEHFNL